MARWALILVPGYYRKPKNTLRDLLVSNLTMAESMRMSVTSSDADMASLAVSASDNTVLPETIDVIEAGWADLIPVPAEEKPVRRLLQGLSLLLYWIGSPGMWQAIFKYSFWIAAGYIFSALLLVLWLLSLLTVAVQTLDVAGIGTPVLPVTPIADAGAPANDAAGGSALLQQMLRDAAVWLTALIPQKYAAALAVIIPLLPVMIMADLAAFTRDYLSDLATDGITGLRARLRMRLQTAFGAALSKDYDRVIIVGHSFGSLIAADTVAGWYRAEDLARVRVVTLGSPGSVLSYRSQWVATEIANAVERRPGFGWTDIHAERDFWSAGLLPADSSRIAEGDVVRMVVDLPGTLVERFNGVVHLAYFRDEAVLRALLGQGSAAGVPVPVAALPLPHLLASE